MFRAFLGGIAIGMGYATLALGRCRGALRRGMELRAGFGDFESEAAKS